MAIWNRFYKPIREFKPLAYYASEKPMGKLLDENDFSQELARNIIMYCLRLHEMGVFEEDKIVTFDIQGMVKTLADWEVLQGVKAHVFTTDAPEIKKNGKIILYLNTGGDCYNFALLDSQNATKLRMMDCLQKLIQFGEVESYEIME